MRLHMLILGEVLGKRVIQRPSGGSAGAELPVCSKAKPRLKQTKQEVPHDSKSDLPLALDNSPIHFFNFDTIFPATSNDVCACKEPFRPKRVIIPCQEQMRSLSFMLEPFS